MRSISAARVQPWALMSVVVVLLIGAVVAQAATKADLSVSKGSAVRAGTTLAVNATVKNGKVKVRATKLALLASRDAKRSKDDRPLGSAAVKAIKASKTQVVRAKVSIAAVPAGTWRLLACADSGSALKEKSETNNCRAIATFVVAAAVPTPTPSQPTPAPSTPAPATPAVPTPTSTTPTTTTPSTPTDSTPPDTTITAGPTGTVTADAVTLSFSSSEAGSTFECQLDLNGYSACASPLTLNDLPGGLRHFDVRAKDAAGNVDASPATREWTLVRPAPAPGPTDAAAPDPATRATAVSQSRATSLADQTSFLYSGANPIQTGVASGAIEEQRVSVLRGCVTNRLDGAIAGVRVAVLDHPELGHTDTRNDGCFDLALNGGGAVTLTFERQGYVPLQRTVAPGWEAVDRVERAVLVPYDTQATEVDLNDPDAPAVQVARGSEVADGDGERQATLMFDKGTAATMHLPDGTTQQLTDLRVRATEFTVDPAGGSDQGPAAMPGDLPATSAFTYAAEFSIDQAVRAGATEVTFDKPVVTYVENFAGIAVGAAVPAGYYDREAGVWRAGPDGRVIKILGEQGTTVTLDIDGDGAADDASKLAALGIDGAELTRLAELYGPGDELWRVQLTHFSPWDFNWPFRPPNDATGPKGPSAGSGGGGGGGGGGGNGAGGAGAGNGPKGKGKGNGPCAGGSIIGCQRQTVGEDVPVQGTELTLHYQSERVPGRDDVFRLQVPVGPAPTSAKSIRATVDVAGRHFEAELPRTQETWAVRWDGLDAYGRRLFGEQPAHVRVAYVYDAQYAASPAELSATFGALPAGQDIVADKARREISYPREWDTTMGAFNAQAVGLGGWTVGVHHFYDPVGRRLYLGSGAERSVAGEVRLQLLKPYAGTTGQGDGGDGAAAIDAQLDEPGGVTALPDGDVLITDPAANRVRRVADGTINAVAGTGTFGSTGDGGAATAARLAEPGAAAVMPDGSILVADTQGNRVRRIDATGTIRTFAGGGSPATGNGDGGAATGARLRAPAGLAVANDGAVFIAEAGGHRIRRVGPEGVISTAAGTGTAGFSGDGGDARTARLNAPQGLAVDGPSGVVYIADTRNDRIRALQPNGTIDTVAGGGAGADIGDGDPAVQARLTRPEAVTLDSSGSLVIADTGNRLVRRVLGDGTILTVVGGGNGGTLRPGGTPTQVRLTAPSGVATTPDGALIVADRGRHQVLRVAPALAGFSDSEVLLPSEDGSELYVFAAATGRHLRTVDALTRVTRWTFGYDAAGLLSTVTDQSGKATTIEHDAAGTPTAIVAPHGQRTVLGVDANGWLDHIEDPAHQSFVATYAGSGLITSFTDPAGQDSHYEYDGVGRVVKVTNAADGVTTYARTEIADGIRVTRHDQLGRDTIYESTRTSSPLPDSPDGAEGDSFVDRVIYPGGATETTTVRSDGTTTIELPSGMVTRSTQAPDPRWGMLAPYTAASSQTSPGGRASTQTRTRSVTQEDPDNLVTLTSMTDQATVDGRTTTSTYDHADHTLTVTSPTGRQIVTTFGTTGTGNGRPVQRAVAGLLPTTVTFDAFGRIATQSQGGRHSEADYDSLGRVVRWEDATGHGTLFTYDDADRVLSHEPIGQDGNGTGALTTYGYNARGQLTTVTTPDGKSATLAYGALQGLTSFTAPLSVTAATWTYDLDGSLKTQTLQDGRTIDQTFDTAGRPTVQTGPEATVTYDYGSAKDARPATITSDPETGATQTVGLTYDGALPLSESATDGLESWSTAYTYDSTDKLIASATLTSGADTVATAFARDADGLPTQLGPYAIARGGPGGAPSSFTAGNDVTTVGYDTFGRESSRTRSIDGTQAYAATTVRDDADRTVSTTQQVADQPAVARSYAYDDEGHLTTVTADTLPGESYVYDARGNITSAQTGGTRTISYRDDDTVSAVDATPYTYNAAGQLATRGADTFAYDAGGRLLAAVVAGGSFAFRYDGLGRRTAKIGPDGTTRYLYGDPADLQRPTAVRRPDGTLVTLRWDASSRLLAVEVGGSRYAVDTDAVGTPVAVHNANGSLDQTIHRSAFGVVIASSSDGSPVALPIGFAGGIDDPELGLVHLGYRDYEPATGHFTTRDPALYGGGQENLYAYADGDPVNSRDRTGLMPEERFTADDRAAMRDAAAATPKQALDWVKSLTPCVGASVYVGLGAGFKACRNPDGSVTTCVEGGTGIGAEGGVEASTGNPNDGFTLSLKGGGKLGAADVSGSADLSLDKCNRPKGEFGAGVSGGPFGASAAVSASAEGVSGSGTAGLAKGKTPFGVGAQVKAAIQHCTTTYF